MSEALSLIMQRIKFTEEYHTAKERMAWLGSTFYYGLCLTTISFLLNMKRTPSFIELSAIMAVSITVFTAAVTYINLQFRMRWQANDWTDAINRVLESYHPRYSVRQYVADLKEFNSNCARQRCKSQLVMMSLLWPILFWRIGKMPSEYNSEVPAYAIAVYLLLSELSLCIARMAPIFFRKYGCLK